MSGPSGTPRRRRRTPAERQPDPTTGEEGYEWRDGRRFKVTRLPDATPPPGRSRTSRYRFEDVGKPGNLAPVDPSEQTRRERRTERFLQSDEGRAWLDRKVAERRAARPDPGPAPERLTRTKLPFFAEINGEIALVSRDLLGVIVFDYDAWDGHDEDDLDHGWAVAVEGDE